MVEPTPVYWDKDKPFGSDSRTINKEYPPTKVYHGTRLSKDFIEKYGLSWPGEEKLLREIKRALEAVGLNYEEWLSGQTKDTERGMVTTLWELREDYRKRIWVSDEADRAMSYATRAPEIVWTAIMNGWIRRHPRQRLSIAAGKANEAIEAIYGEPLLVTIDAQKVGARGGINESLREPVPPEAILSIRPIKVRGHRRVKRIG